MWVDMKLDIVSLIVLKSESFSTKTIGQNY